MPSPINMHTRPSNNRKVMAHQHSSSSSSSCCNWKCFACTLVSFAVLLGAIALAAGAYYFLHLEANKRELKETHAYLRELIQKVNTSPDARWRAKFNPFGMRKSDFNSPKTLKNLTAVKEHVEHIQRFFKSEQMQTHLSELEEFPTASLPREFDARKKWSHCPSLHHVPNQGGCGSCYAVASMSVASDRTCIYTNGSYRSELSSYDVLSCCKVCGNCYGGDPIKALVYWALEGVVSGGKDGCRPYQMDTSCGTPCKPDSYSNGESNRRCVRKCQSGYYRKGAYADDRHFGSIAYTLYPRKMSIDQGGKERVMLPSVIGHFNDTSTTGPLSPEQVRSIIMKELYLFGPTTMALPLTEEFLHYESGVFHPFPMEDYEKRIIYWHVVRLIGWGRDVVSGKHHWLAINSFGEEWGEQGTVRVDTSMLEHFGLEYETGLL